VKKMGSRASGWTATTTPARMKANRVKMGSRASNRVKMGSRAVKMGSRASGLRNGNDDKGLGWSPTPGRFLGFVQPPRDRLMGKAALLGWRVLRFTRSMIASGEAVRDIAEALTGPIS
jgi:hypothetical protein